MDVDKFVNVTSSRAMASPLGRKRLLTRRPLLGLVLVVALAAWATSTFQSFVAPLSASGRAGGTRRTRSPTHLQPLRSVPRTVASAAAMELEEEEEMNDFEKFLDRYNTRGGVILLTVVAVIGGLLFEKFLELFLAPVQAGLWVSGLLSIAIFWWTGTYFVRVINKGTTYAKQLKQYEQMVMLKRLEELDDEEIDALCEEVGVSSEELAEATGGVDKRKSLSKKEQVLKLFKIQKMSQDPRNIMGAS